MPKLAPTHPDDLSMGPAHGTVGKSRAWGLYLHRYVVDVSDNTPQSIDDFNIFEPHTSVRPIMVVYASFIWQLENTNMDNAEVSIGSNGAVDDLIQASPVAAGSSGDVFGNRLAHPKPDTTGGLLLRDMGNAQHAHWEKVLSGYAGGDPLIGLPVKMRIDSTPASASAYAGTVTAHILWTPLRAF